VENEGEDQYASLVSSGNRQAMLFSMPDPRLPNIQNDTLTVQAAYHLLPNFLDTQSQGLAPPGNRAFSGLTVEISKYQKNFPNAQDETLQSETACNTMRSRIK
jgi:hypothetical protein